jgi:hypothetical protein
MVYFHRTRLSLVGGWMKEASRLRDSLSTLSLPLTPRILNSKNVQSKRESVCMLVRVAFYIRATQTVFWWASIVLLDVLEKLRCENNVDTYTELTKDLHFYPDFHGEISYTSILSLFTFVAGNRSPIADSRMRGSIVGLELVSYYFDREIQRSHLDYLRTHL